MDQFYLKARTVLVEYLMEKGIPEAQAHYWAVEMLARWGREGLTLTHALAAREHAPLPRG